MGNVATSAVLPTTGLLAFLEEYQKELQTREVDRVKEERVRELTELFGIVAVHQWLQDPAFVGVVEIEGITFVGNQIQLLCPYCGYNALSASIHSPMGLARAMVGTPYLHNCPAQQDTSLSARLTDVLKELINETIDER